jgi:hypothetical protein
MSGNRQQPVRWSGDQVAGDLCPGAALHGLATTAGAGTAATNLDGERLDPEAPRTGEWRDVGRDA